MSGRGWALDERELLCPITKDVLATLKEWWPDYMYYGDATAAIGVFGLEHHYDFFYAVEAYGELKRRRPQECGRFTTIYRRRWQNCRIGHNIDWIGRDGIMPKISFD